MSDENFVKIARMMMTYNFEISDLPDDLKCVKCKLALKDACQVPCGCTFCRACIDDMLVREIKFCPGLSDDCRESSLELFESDYRANINVSKLTAKCVIDGCMQECELGNMEEHLRECPKRNVECPFRESGCEEGYFLAEEMNEHLYLKHLTHSEILIGMIANMKQDIEMLVQNKEESRKELDLLKKSMGTDIKVLKQKNENNKKEIELLRQKDEQRRKEIDVLKQRDEDNKKEIEVLKQKNENNKKEIGVMKPKDEEIKIEIGVLKRSLLQKDEQIKVIRDQMVSATRKDNLTPSVETPIKQQIENLVDRVKNLSVKLNEEIELSEKTHNLDIFNIGKIDNKLTEAKKVIESNKEELTNEVNSMKIYIQLLDEETEVIKTDVQYVKSQLQSTQALVGPVDASCEWLINQNVRTTSWEKGSHRSECFVGENRPYKYRLASWNGSGSLWIMLFILPGSHDDQLAWPFEGRVVITVADKDRREACRRISRPCKIWRPLDSDGKISDYFKFSHSELTEAGLDLSPGLSVSCVIVSIAGA